MCRAAALARSDPQRPPARRRPHPFSSRADIEARNFLFAIIRGSSHHRPIRQAALSAFLPSSLRNDDGQSGSLESTKLRGGVSFTIKLLLVSRRHRQSATAVAAVQQISGRQKAESSSVRPSAILPQFAYFALLLPSLRPPVGRCYRAPVFLVSCQATARQTERPTDGQHAPSRPPAPRTLPRPSFCSKRCFGSRLLPQLTQDDAAAAASRCRWSSERKNWSTLHWKEGFVVQSQEEEEKEEEERQ